MIHLSHPLRLLLLLPWAIFLVVCLRSQLSTLKWLRARVSPRLLPTLTRSTRAGLGLHTGIFLVCGTLLLAAAAGPWVQEQAKTVIESPTVILIVDGSLSMGAGDATTHPLTGEDVDNRFGQARAFCLDLLAAMPDSPFALITFSGAAVVHSPPTRDHHALETVLRTMKYHYYSAGSGSRFSTAFDAVIHFVGDRDADLRVVLLSDGEISVADEWDDQLQILAANSIPLHTVAVGSESAWSMSVYEIEDVLTGSDEPRIAAKYETTRDEKNLRRMSRKTGGSAFVVEYGHWVRDLLKTLEDSAGVPMAVSETTRKDLSRHFLAAFLVLFLVEIMALSTPSRRDRPAHLPWGAGPRSGHSSPSLVVLIGIIGLTTLNVGCRAPLWRTHVLNERGIEKLEEESHEQASTLFERSAAFRSRAHIPIYNRGLTGLELEDFTAAHREFEKAILLRPRMTEAHFNDGHTLYLWGEEEIDPSGCDLERTRTLWQQAKRRFERSADLAGPFSCLRPRALENAAIVEEQLRMLDELAEECPESNASSNAPPDSKSPPSGGGGGEGSTGGKGQKSPDLTQEEQDLVSQELERIRGQAAGVSTFRQAGPMQLEPGDVEKAEGQKIWW